MQWIPIHVLASLVVWLQLPSTVLSQYVIDDSRGVGRQFDGIGGLSGGSATSKLLIGYPQKQRDEILDYLFKPSFGASLQILKVEIGGDAQASDATEASHMHVPWEENYERGYEWWLMKEAKKRNPQIKLYGLPWAFPGWIGNGTQNPYINRELLADYIYRWINGAKVQHNLDIDYIGIWNERYCDTEYLKILRKTLDKKGYYQTSIVASDNWFDPKVTGDTSVVAAFDVLGAHYPGVVSPEVVKQLGKKLWSSEDYSTFNDDVGGGCWARILNQNYESGLMTSTIAWNLIDSFYQGLPWDRTSLMTARQPWSGYYSVESPIWMSAHTTQFTEIGWSYLPHGLGVGALEQGGSYVSLTSPDHKDLTIVIEKMSHDHSPCIRPALPPYTVANENATIQLEGSFAGVTALYVWQSVLRFDSGASSTYFLDMGSVPVINGKVTVAIGVDQVLTLTTVPTGTHGTYDAPPPPAAFPLPFFEDFEKYPLSAEPFSLAPQQGSFDVVNVGGTYGKVMRQMVLQPPIAWCQETLYFNSSLNLLGRFNWTDVEVQVDVKVGQTNGSNGVFIGVRIDNGGCQTYVAKGLFFFIFPNDNIYLLASDIQGKNVLTSGREKVAIVSDWNHLTLTVQGQTVTGSCNNQQLFSMQVPNVNANGFVGLGTDVYGYADFDNFRVDNSSTSKVVGKPDTLYFVEEDMEIVESFKTPN
ncbi:galactocerebrosidase [Aplysia californica]|uniref:galactosylceramidase n=1 Tax=Aplysia californica TaxID=6500 RepID=A0ABM1VNN9_APLCA|nr:galactocerebrosidase [Aplysia californica]XP_005092191.1 galactocerebrosidase [Aplysia californica]XP_035824031.1 galactocerebrosidase [Aplysia californica]